MVITVRTQLDAMGAVGALLPKVMVMRKSGFLSLLVAVVVHTCHLMTSELFTEIGENLFLHTGGETDF